VNPDKQRYRITRESLLKLLNKTEDTIKQGLTFDEVLPFFVRYKLKLRVFNIFYQRIFTYDPPVENFNNKPMYVLADGDHIYTLNHDLKRLQQTQSEDTDEAYVVQASVDYKLRTDNHIADFKMIKHIDDILDIIRAKPANDGDDNQQHVT